MRRAVLAIGVLALVTITAATLFAGSPARLPAGTTVAGLDVFWDPVAVRRKIGYLPENCPLYPEMRVSEYLTYRGGIKGMHGRACRTAVERVVERCWLTDVRRQLVGTLSKGFRQRVGLADAILHDPPVLILDEPVSGLDPHGIREVREIICRERDRGRLVFLSSHVLSEVERTADRIGMLRQGRLVFEGGIEDIMARHATLEEAFLSITGAVASAADAAH